VCGLKPSLKAWKPCGAGGVWVERGGVRAEALPEGVEAPAGLGCAWVGGGSGVRAKALSEGVEAPAGLGRAWAEGRGVRAKALSEGVEAPAGLGRAWAEGMQVKVDPGCIILDLFFSTS
jgi:hypothetical protein